MQNRCLPVGRAPHFIFFFSTPPRIRTLTYWVGTSSATVTPRAFSHQFFVFFCPNLTLFAIQNFSGNARNRTSRQLPHNLRQEGYNLPCGNAPQWLKTAGKHRIHDTQAFSGSRGTRTHNGFTRSCFQNSVLIRPDDFRR